jgi:hypothetical protein
MGGGGGLVLAPQSPHHSDLIGMNRKEGWLFSLLAESRDEDVVGAKPALGGKGLAGEPHGEVIRCGTLRQDDEGCQATGVIGRVVRVMR